MAETRVGTRAQWLEERRALLQLEKEHKRASDALAEKRRSLPWVAITEDYRFTGPEGEVGLADGEVRLEQERAARTSELGAHQPRNG